jgi:hypothetical protein
MANLVQTADGAADWDGYDHTRVGFIPVNTEYNVPAADKLIFVATRRMIVKSISGCPSVAGTGGACTAVVKKASGTTAIASGTAVHSGSYDLVGTVNTVQNLTLSATASDLVVEAGDRLGIDFTGTATSALGVITVFLAPA